MNTGNSIEERVARVEAILAIKALMRRYSNLCDQGFDPEGISALFVDDGVWDGRDGGAGLYEGKTAIRDFLAGLADVVSWSGHFVVNEEFDVSGDRAEGFWRCIAIVNNPGEDPQTDKFYFQDYHFACRRVAGNWMFETIRADLRKATAYLPHMSGQAPVVE